MCHSKSKILCWLFGFSKAILSFTSFNKDLTDLPNQGSPSKVFFSCAAICKTSVFILYPRFFLRRRRLNKNLYFDLSPNKSKKNVYSSGLCVAFPPYRGGLGRGFLFTQIHTPILIQLPEVRISQIFYKPDCFTCTFHFRS